MGRNKHNMGYFNILLMVAPALAQISSNPTAMPSLNTTTTHNYPQPTTTTTSPDHTPITTTIPTTYPQPTTTTTQRVTTTTGEEVCTGHVCLPEENGFFAEGCCDNSYCQCYGGVGHLKHCDGDGVFNEELQACDWDWHVPCCNASMPTLPTPEEKCQAIDCHEDGYFPEGKCEDIFCQCIGGVGHVQHCHDGLFFNPAISVCDWPWNNPGCNGDSTDPTPETTTTTTTSEPAEECSFNCFEADNGVYAEGCCENTYCQCFAGQGYLHYCPPNSVFNSQLGYCDHPDSVECCNNNSTTTSTSFPDITGNTTMGTTTTTKMPSTTTTVAPTTTVVATTTVTATTTTGTTPNVPDTTTVALTTTAGTTTTDTTT